MAWSVSDTCLQSQLPSLSLNSRVMFEVATLMKTKSLFVASALIEAGAGLALIVSPALTVSLLIGVPFDIPAAAVVGRLTGAALLALALACWISRDDTAGPSVRGLVAGLSLYNGAAVVVLSWSGLGLRLTGIGLWPAVALHLGMAAWCLASLRKN